MAGFAVSYGPGLITVLQGGSIVKAAKIGGLVILFAVVAVVGYVIVNAGDIVKQIIEDVGSDALGCVGNRAVGGPVPGRW